ncbi:MAG TPA: hypothetical protein ENJ18_04275 [Nannocystis exedens]|nr:hypothetical protein [Nannocystis exedens]
MFTHRQPAPRPLLCAAQILAVFAVFAVFASACGTSRDAGSRVSHPGNNSVGQTDRFVKKAVHRAPEGFILIPGARAERAFDRQRLVQLAQDLRQPAAACFINRTIDTAQWGEVDGERALLGVPEGQMKIRVRIAPQGKVLRTDVLEGAFGDADEVMEACLRDVLMDAHWPENRSGNTHWIDAIYWVSLGFQAEDRSPEMAVELRRQQAMLANKGKGCLEGRVRPGQYRVEGLSLLDREGRTLVNRLEPTELGQEIANCLVVVLRALRMPRVSDAFVRPFAPAIEYQVSPKGEVSFTDERWLELLLLEEKAAREQRRAELAAERSKEEGEVPEGLTDLVLRPEDEDDEVPEPGSDPEPPKPAPVADPEPPKPAPVADPKPPNHNAADPGKGGLKLKLGGRPSG